MPELFILSTSSFSVTPATSILQTDRSCTNVERCLLFWARCQIFPTVFCAHMRSCSKLLSAIRSMLRTISVGNASSARNSRRTFVTEKLVFFSDRQIFGEAFLSVFYFVKQLNYFKLIILTPDNASQRRSILWEKYERIHSLKQQLLRSRIQTCRLVSKHLTFLSSVVSRCY